MRPILRSTKASFWKRLLAFLVDSIALGLVTVVAVYLLELDDIVESVFMVVTSYTSSITLEYFYQTTIGKSMLKLLVMRVDGRKPKFSDTFCRNIGKIASALPLYYGFTRILAPHRRQTIHDEIARCLVVEAG